MIFHCYNKRPPVRSSSTGTVQPHPSVPRRAEATMCFPGAVRCRVLRQLVACTEQTMMILQVIQTKTL